MNIAYKTTELRDYYQNHRNSWQSFYPSERWIMEHISDVSGSYPSVLDVGCATGGLATALAERFSLGSYLGVDINSAVIEHARKTHASSPSRQFICGDICQNEVSKSIHHQAAEAEHGFSHVFSLSCADFNLEPMKIISNCWKQVRPGGYFVISLRLTPELSVNDISRSYQYISFAEDGGTGSEEIANYVVLNFQDALNLAAGLLPQPANVTAYGYWGSPSAAAVTPYKKLVFGVFAIQKPEVSATGQIGEQSSISTALHLPLDLFISVPETSLRNL
jgi:SAM-dependent methyltransferase